MRLVFLYGSLLNGGAERVITLLSNIYANNGIEVSIVVLDNGKCGYEINSNIDIIAFNIAHDSRNLKEKLIMQYNKVKKIRNTLLKIKPDSVMVFDAELAIITKFAIGNKYPVIGSERGNPFYTKVGIRGCIVKYSSIILNGFIFQTYGAQKFYPQLLKLKSKVIPNPSFLQVDNMIDYSARNNVIMATGRLSNVKRYDLLILAFSQIHNKIPGYIVEIYGDGEKKKELDNMIKNLGLENKIFLKGRVKNIGEILLNNKIFVLTSDSEGMPNGLIEAMICGCACISTDCNFGPRDLIEQDVNGCLITPGSVEEVKNAILKVVMNEKFATKLAENAKNIKKVVDSEKIAKEYLDYIKLCAKEV